MKIVPTELDSVFVIEPEPVSDERGWFARTFSLEAFADRGLITDFVQHSISFNRLEGTLRGLHWQASPGEEAKLIRCTAGAVYDVVVDVRPGSPSHLRHVAFTLSAENRLAIYVGKGLAHGFVTLTDASELHYQISAPYDPALARGARWNDPALAIAWPVAPAVISARDRSWPDLTGPSAALR